MFDLETLQFGPSPIQDLVCADGDEERLEDRPTAMLVELTLTSVSKGNVEQDPDGQALRACW